MREERKNFRNRESPFIDLDDSIRGSLETGTNSDGKRVRDKSENETTVVLPLPI